jgi:CubicO group peptidase (beta-lactamase class C family)
MKRRFALTVLPLAIALVAARPVVRDHPADDRFERLAALVTAKMTEYGVPGVGFGVLHGGETAARGLGVTSVDNPLPVTEDTLFQVGSISKTFTGTAVMRLVDQGKVRLDATVRTYVPDFSVQDANASANVTVRDLLTHTSGWEGDLFEDTGGGDDALARMMVKMRDLEQVAPLRAVWSYNNAGFYVAGRIIEIASGQTYEEALTDLVLAPIGLERTYIHPADAMTRRFVVGHGPGPSGPRVLTPWPLARAAHAAGGVISSASEMLRYARFHLGDGTGAGGARALSPATLDAMRAPVLVKHGTDDEMALTWHLSTSDGVKLVSHGGSTMGQQALLTLVPRDRFAVVLLTNGSRGSRLNTDVSRAALKEYLGLSVTDPEPLAAQPDLAAFAGDYTRPHADVTVAVQKDRLLVQTITKRGFPTPKTPPPRPGPPMPFAFYAPDRLIAVDGPQKGARAEVIRLADGSIGWVRVGGRIHRRVPKPGTAP